MVALAETDIGAGEKLTSPTEVVETPAEFEEPFFAGTLGAATGTTGLGAGLGAGLTAGLATGFCSAIGTPFAVGVSKATVFTGAGVGFGVGFGDGFTGALTGVAFGVGAFAVGVFEGTATVRVVVTDLAQTVTDVGPVFDE